VQLHPIPPGKIIAPGASLALEFEAALALNGIVLQEGDILVVAETVVGTCEKRIVDLGGVEPSGPAEELAERYGLDPRLAQVIMDEADQILDGVPGVVLTMKQGVLIANAGIDHSNSGGGDLYSLYPHSPFASAAALRTHLMEKFGLHALGVVISDSKIAPLRRGVIGIAIGVAGICPVDDCRGRVDLFGEPLKFTTRALADQLASAAHLLMGEADEGIPFVLVRDAPVPFTDDPVEPSELLMPVEGCLIMNSIKNLID
jgi:coenzyme F420-0:L-glutamate ligase